jgi:hypothetical protein
MAGPAKPPVPLKVRDEIAGGVYANNMMVSHTREEFVLDFVYLAPTQAVLNARVISSPGHLKRIIKALSENLRRYEDQYGAIQEGTPPKKDKTVN